jgi:hypothetical protein
VTDIAPIRHLGTTWLAPGLGEPVLTDMGDIVFVGDAGECLAFACLDDLDAVIGELHAARYRVAYEQRKSAEKDRVLRHYSGVLADAQAEAADRRTTGDGDTAA